MLEARLARIDTTDGRVNAFTGRSIDRARAEAAAVDQRRARGEVLPPLAGVPYAVKNLFDIAGEVTLAGSKVERDHAPASADAFLVQRMQAAGAVLVGSLNMDEYAYGFTTENTHYGPCHNPHDLTRIAGGSSGGSGAAVGAGQVPITLGSDTNGSIRVPSSLCGVWGSSPHLAGCRGVAATRLSTAWTTSARSPIRWMVWRWPTMRCRVRTPWTRVAM